MGCYGYKHNVSSAIDKLAQNGAIFENCFTCSNASDPALTSIMSGMQTRSHGILRHSFEINDSELKTLEKRNDYSGQRKRANYLSHFLDSQYFFKMRSDSFLPNERFVFFSCLNWNVTYHISSGLFGGKISGIEYTLFFSVANKLCATLLFQLKSLEFKLDFNPRILIN